MQAIKPVSHAFAYPIDAPVCFPERHSFLDWIANPPVYLRCATLLI
ncbi:MAG: hypothetical protein RMI34_11750 [Chloroherpetonaceae bacterium]|nr:hypothetical protein [Chloroherpetonaceae bacterium]MCS7212027.1 hypothetical protein [Chloroherpetonaceae bacterium]MDW8020731.1 hypothetical protein [Chloroherpetonaceae bacterium]MDW8465717.1 hypothetical protein [Chloroherpetonaceae bacterium]